MALVSCWECDLNVSSYARDCPNCGAPKPAWKCLKCDGTVKLKGEKCDGCKGYGIVNNWVKNEWCGEQIYNQ